MITNEYHLVVSPKSIRPLLAGRRDSKVNQTVTQTKDTMWAPQWLDKWAQENGLPLLTDVNRTGKELGRGHSSVVEEVVYNGKVYAMKVPFSSYKNHMLR